MSLPKLIGDRLKSLRKSKGLSQKQLADLSSIHFTYIGQVERGEKNISIDALERVINVLDITFEELFRNLPKNSGSVQDMKLELLYNRIQEKKPQKKEAIVTLFLSYLDLLDGEEKK